MIRSAARRLALPLAVIAGGVALVAGVALLAGSSAARSLAVGLYAMGAIVAVIGFGIGSRSLFKGPGRPRTGDEGHGLAGLWESAEIAAVLIALGILLLVAGIAADPHARLI